MKRNLAFAIALLSGLAVIAVFGQAPVTPEKEAEIAQKQFTAAATKLDAAYAEYSVALANRNAALWKVVAAARITPSECEAPGPDGKPNPFACVKIDPVTGVVSAQKIPKPAPSATP